MHDRRDFDSSGASAAATIAAVRDRPYGRLELLRSVMPAASRAPRRCTVRIRAALAFMGWQLQRGLLDVGVIVPRLTALYRWSADELGTPALIDLVCDATPAYAWDPAVRRVLHWLRPSS